MLGRLFHILGAEYKKQLSNDFWESVLRDLLVTDAHVDIVLLIWLNKDMFALKSSECTRLKNWKANDNTSISENVAKQNCLKLDSVNTSAICDNLFSSADDMVHLLLLKSTKCPHRQAKVEVRFKACLIKLCYC